MPNVFNRFVGRYSNPDVPSLTAASEGVVLTADASADTQGTAVELVSGANAAYNIWGFLFVVTRGNVSAQDSSTLLEILYDPAAGTSYTTLIPEFPVGNSGRTQDGGGMHYWFPRWCPAGSKVVGRIRSAVGSTTCEVRTLVVYQPTRPELAFRGTYAEQIGTRTGSRGTAIGSIGTSGSEGTWISLGTTAQNLHHLALCPSLHDAAIQAGVTWFDLATGDGTNFNLVTANITLFGGISETICKWLVPGDFIPCRVAAGTGIYVRGSTNLATADVCNAMVIGIGGGY